MGERVYHI